MREEQGVSLVEMLVSILLLALVLAALGQSLFTSMAAARQNQGLTQATALANERLETLKGAPWGTLVAGAPVVTTVSAGDGRQYTMTTTITDVDARLKTYTVLLEWIENGGDQQLQVQGRRARRPGENPSAPPQNPFRVRTFVINPDPVHLDTSGKSLPATNPALPGNAAMLLEVELSEAARANSVIATWPTNQSLTLTEVAGTLGKKWSGTIPSGITYSAGWLPFRVTAAKAGTTTTCTASPLPTSPNCTETYSSAYLMAPIANGPLYYDSNKQRLYSGTPGVTGDRLCLKETTARLRNNNPFYLGLKGLGTDDTVVLRRTDVAGVQFPMTWTKVQTNWWWYADVATASAGTFTPGVNSTWEIQWTRNYDGLTSTIPLTFHVMNANGNNAC